MSPTEYMFCSIKMKIVGYIISHVSFDCHLWMLRHTLGYDALSLISEAIHGSTSAKNRNEWKVTLKTHIISTCG